MDLSLVITGWLPYFHKLHLLSRQEKMDESKSFCLRTLAFYSGREQGQESMPAALN